MQRTQDRAPLAAHPLFRSTDLDEAREKVAAVFCPHRLDIFGQRRIDARQHHLRGDRLSLNYIEYGARTLIAPGEMGGFYLLQIPLSGMAAIANGGQSYCSDPGRAALLNPHLPTKMIWEEGTRQVLVQIDRQAMQDHLSGALGAPAEAALTFDGPLDMTGGAGAGLRRLVMWLVAETDAGNSPIGRGGMMARQVEGAVLSGLLDCAGHNYVTRLSRSHDRVAGPRHLRLAEAHIEAHLTDPLSLADIAAAAGMGQRALQLAFREHRGTTPLGWWRDRRLDRAQVDLAAGRGNVTDIALRWGFTHFGRFSQAYRARFGCCPRDTLRRAGLPH